MSKHGEDICGNLPAYVVDLIEPVQSGLQFNVLSGHPRPVGPDHPRLSWPPRLGENDRMSGEVEDHAPGNTFSILYAHHIKIGGNGAVEIIPVDDQILSQHAMTYPYPGLKETLQGLLHRLRGSLC